MFHQQLCLEGLFEGSYWVRVYGHATVEDGARFLIVGKSGSWLVGWRDGMRPLGEGTYLRSENFVREGEA